jgi:hypothetical protein
MPTGSSLPGDLGWQAGAGWSWSNFVLFFYFFIFLIRPRQRSGPRHPAGVGFYFNFFFSFPKGGHSLAMAVSRDPGKGDQLGSASFWRMFFFIIKKNSFFLNSQVKPQGLGSSRSWKDFSLSFFFFFLFLWWTADMFSWVGWWYCFGWFLLPLTLCNGLLSANYLIDVLIHINCPCDPWARRAC